MKAAHLGMHHLRQEPQEDEVRAVVQSEPVVGVNPVVLAVGEGPSSWTDFLTQQLRWSRGTYETLLKHIWKAPFRLSPGALLNYFFLLSWYPLVAVTWTLGGVSLALYFGWGAQGLDIDPQIWAMLYGNAVALQLGLYIWNRRHNISPHEPEGSSGLAGMAMTVMTAPIYARSLMDAVLRRKSKFVVTPKGDSASPDRLLGTFRVHLLWAAAISGFTVYGIIAHHSHPAMLTWAGLMITLSLSPVAIWLRENRKQRRKWLQRRSA